MKEKAAVDFRHTKPHKDFRRLIFPASQKMELAVMQFVVAYLLHSSVTWLSLLLSGWKAADVRTQTL